jgi:hypothetical protein
MNKFAEEIRNKLRVKILEALDVNALWSAARDTDLTRYEVEHMTATELRAALFERWSDAEEAIFRHFDGAKDNRP